jgi:hypothetical protein
MITKQIRRFDKGSPVPEICKIWNSFGDLDPIEVATQDIYWLATQKKKPDRNSNTVATGIK